MNNKFALILVLVMASVGHAGLYDEAVFRVDFGNDSASDVSSPSSTGTVTDVSFVDISSMLLPNSNGRGAVFNGTSSSIDYRLGAERELKIEDAVTYHIRVRFDAVDNQQFLMGRSQSDDRFVTLLQTEGTTAWGYLGVKKKNGFEKIGHKAEDCLKPGIFYDIFFRFSPYVKGQHGSIRTYVYNAQTGKQVAVSRNWGTSIRRMYDADDINFRIGKCGNDPDFSGLKGTVDQVNVWKKALTKAQMQSLSKSHLPNSFPAGAYRKPLFDKEKETYTFYEDFENRDSVTLWKNYGRPYKVNFKGLTEEHAFSGKKSFKLDVTFGKPGRYIWYISPGTPHPSAEGKSLSGYMLIGKQSNVRVTLGVAFCFPPTESGGFTGPGKGHNTTEDRWVRIDVDGNALMTNFKRFGDSMGDLMIHTYAGYINREDIIPSIGKIRIDISVKHAGDRLVVYIDDVGLKDNNGKTAKPSSPSHALKRYKDKMSQLEKQVIRAERIIAKTAWTEEMAWVKKALDAGVADAKKSLPELKSRIPFPVSEFARIDDKVVKITDTLGALEKLKLYENADHIIYIVDCLTSKNFWILPFDDLIPGKIEKRLSLTGCRGEYEAVSFVVKAMKDLKDLTIDCSSLAAVSGSDLIPKDNIDLKIVKCWYQGPNVGVANEHNNKTTKMLVPELLVNDDSLVKVDYEKKENFLKLTFPDRQKYKDINNRKKAKESISITDCPVKDSKILLPVDLHSGKNQQFWITVKIPDGIPAGNYTGKIRLLSENKVIDNLVLTVTVLSFDLMPPYYTASIDYHGTLHDKPEIASFRKTKTQMLAELKNLVAHGFTNCQHYFSVNDESLKNVLELRAKAGMSNRVLYLKGHCINLGNPTDKNLETIKSKVRRIIKIAKDYGTEEVYFYGKDERTGANLYAQRKAWQAVREAGGKIFVAGGRDNLTLMGDIQDMLVKAGWPDQEHVTGWHNKGHKIFCYANPFTGIENPETYRRNYGLLLWKYNYDGIAINAYQHSWGFVWNDFDHFRYRSMSMVYPTINGVVDTIAWEGFREGIDDVRYITTLEKMIEQAKKRNGKKSSVVISAAENFLSNLRQNNTIESANLDVLRKKIIKHIIDIAAAQS